LQIDSDSAAAVDECRAALEVMSAVQCQVGIAMARFYLGVALYSSGQHAEAEDQLRQSEEYHRSQLRRDGPDGGVASGLAHMILWRSRNLVPLGALREAVRLADEAVARFRAQGSSRGLARALLWAAEAEAQAGQLPSALERLNAVAEVSTHLGATTSEAESLLTAADLYDRVGDRHRAAATRARALTLARKIDSEQGRRLRERALRQGTPVAG
jgi:tetratricopeptide (TPR) repeat protein